MPDTRFPYVDESSPEQIDARNRLDHYMRRWRMLEEENPETS